MPMKKSKNYRKAKIKVNPWGSALYILVGETLADAAAGLPDGFAKDVSKFDDAAALTLSDGANSFAICFSCVDQDIGTVAHEVFHATLRILSNCHANLDMEHDEQGAYLHGWLVKQVVKQFRDWDVDL